mgnify:CR=1 FL=1
MHKTKKEQQLEAYEVWAKDKTPENMSTLLRTLDSTINSISSTHGASNDENLKWAIRVHLAIDISNRFNPDKASLQTFIYQSMQRVPRIKAQQRNIVHTPESSDTDMRRVRQTRQELIDLHDREPTRAEISDRAGISLKRIEKLEGRFGRPEINLSAYHTETGGLDPLDVNLPSATAKEQLFHNYAVDALDSTDRRIYDYLNQDTPLSKKDIAESIGVSAPAVSQRIEKINKELRFNE